MEDQPEIALLGHLAGEEILSPSTKSRPAANLSRSQELRQSVITPCEDQKVSHLSDAGHDCLVTTLCGCLGEEDK